MCKPSATALRHGDVVVENLLVGAQLEVTMDLPPPWLRKGSSTMKKGTISSRCCGSHATIVRKSRCAPLFPVVEVDTGHVVIEKRGSFVLLDVCGCET